MMFGVHVDYPPCFVTSKFDFGSLISAQENGLQQIVQPHPLRDETIALITCTYGIEHM